MLEIPDSAATFLILTVCLLLLALAYWLIQGRRLNLYFTEREVGEDPENYTPVSMSVERLPLLQSLVRNQWREGIELTLQDNSQRTFSFYVEFHFFWRFRLKTPNATEVRINGVPIDPDRFYRLKDESSIEFGDKELMVYITTTHIPEIKSAFT